MTQPTLRWKPSPLLAVSMLLHLVAVVLWLLQPRFWPWALGAIVANHILLTLLGLLPRSTWLGPNWTRLPATAAARREIALTIDDGPDPEVTPKVLDILDRHGAKASFFCIGEKAQRYPELCREIVRRGHAVENHSQHHWRHFSLLGVRGMAREIETASATLAAITGQRPLFFRPTAGLRNPFLDPALSRCRMRLASWTRRAFDTREGNAQVVLARLSRDLKAGDILLLHDGNAARTAEGVPVILAALPPLLDAIGDAGLHTVTLRSLIA
jgi:peptidoglycan/xylan/chitin deacetylase (PgdA/CDA1 family)